MAEEKSINTMIDEIKKRGTREQLLKLQQDIAAKKGTGMRPEVGAELLSAGSASTPMKVAGRGADKITEVAQPVLSGADWKQKIAAKIAEREAAKEAVGLGETASKSAARSAVNVAEHEGASAARSVFSRVGRRLGMAIPFVGGAVAAFTAPSDANASEEAVYGTLGNAGEAIRATPTGPAKGSPEAILEDPNATSADRQAAMDLIRRRAQGL